MPTNLSSTGEAFPTQTAPIAGEPRTAGSVATPFQNATDRTAYLKRRLDIIQTDDEGIRRVRRVASIAALQALTIRPDKTIVQVDGVGLYQFDTASVLTELSPLVIKPSDIVHPNPGRWLVAGIGRGMFDVANGVPSLDSSALLPTSRLAAATDGRIRGNAIKNGLVDYKALYSLGPYSTPSSSMVDIASPQVAMTAENGDFLEVSVSCSVGNLVGSPDTAAVQLVSVSPSAVTAVVPGSQSIASEADPSMTSFTVFVPINASGIWTVKLQHSANSGGGTASTSAITMIGKLYRP